MELIKIGKIVNTHGIKGELRLLSKFPYKDKVFKVGNTIYINKDTPEIINSYRVHKNFDMITLKGYNNINEVLKYKGFYAYIDKNDIKLDQDNYLDEDLLGLDIIYKDECMGTLYNIERNNKMILLIIRKANKEYLVPYSLIEKIDINSHKIYIKNIDGLFL